MDGLRALLLRSKNAWRWRGLAGVLRGAIHGVMVPVRSKPAATTGGLGFARCCSRVVVLVRSKPAAMTGAGWVRAALFVRWRCWLGQTHSDDRGWLGFARRCSRGGWCWLGRNPLRRRGLVGVCVVLFVGWWRSLGRNPLRHGAGWGLRGPGRRLVVLSGSNLRWRVSGSSFGWNFGAKRKSGV